MISESESLCESLERITSINMAYKFVLRDMMLNGPDMFKGMYDAKNGDEYFMYGIQTVIEYIAGRCGDAHIYKQISNMFTKHILDSQIKSND